MIRIEKLRSGDSIWIYGSGTFAGQVAVKSIDLGLDILGFCDHMNSGKVVSELFEKLMVSEYSSALKGVDKPIVIIGVCNLYGDLRKIANSIFSICPDAVVITPVEFNKILISRGYKAISNYWMPTLPEEIEKFRDQIDQFRKILSDTKSRDLFDSILRYRVDGKLEDLNDPEPLELLYLPPDLRTPPALLNMLDLGACRGENLELFLKSTRKFLKSIFLEPDPENAEYLKQKIEGLGLSSISVLNLAGWSSKTILKFRAAADGSSGFSEVGDIEVSATDIDSLTRDTEVNT